jgi:hypothetical protein
MSRKPRRRCVDLFQLIGSNPVRDVADAIQVAA